MSQLMRLNTKIDQLFRSLPDLLRDISEKDNEQIMRIAIAAQRFERFAFLVRGICASILKQRCPNRLSGGRGKRDELGHGIQAQMARLAEQVGVDRRTLETDARIKDTFFPVVEETTLVLMHTLAREYFVIALAAPEPQAAIKVALEKRDDPAHTLEVFRSYVRELKRNIPTKIKSEAKQMATLRVLIPVGVQQALLELIKFNGQSREEVVADAILNLHQAVFRKRRSKRKTNGYQLTLAI